MRNPGMTDDIIHGQNIPEWVKPWLMKSIEQFLRDQKEIENNLCTHKSKKIKLNQYTF